MHKVSCQRHVSDRLRYVPDSVPWSLAADQMTAGKLAFDTRPTGGRFCPPPLLDFLDSSKTAADIDVELSLPLPASILRLPPKFKEKLSRPFLENDVLVTSCFAILGKKRQMFEVC